MGITASNEGLENAQKQELNPISRMCLEELKKITMASLSKNLGLGLPRYKIQILTTALLHLVLNNEI
jgi:hypothetical protein